MPTSRELLESIINQAWKLTKADDAQIEGFNDDLKQIDEDLDGLMDEWTAMSMAAPPDDV